MTEIIKHPAAMKDDGDDLGIIDFTGKIPPMPASTFKVIWAKDIRPTLGGNWLIKGAMPGVGTGLVFGESGTFKSFAIIDALYAVACGRKVWGDFPIKRNGMVVYVCAEGEGGIQDRLTATRIKHGVGEDEDVPFVVIPARPRLGVEKGDCPMLIETIKQLTPPGVDVVAVVIDTVSQTLGGGDENGTGAQNFLRAITEIASEFKCITIGVHHVGKGDPTRARGHSSLDGNTDFKWLVSRSGEAMSAIITLDKVKDGKHRGASFPITMKEIVLGIDEDGAEATSLAVAEVGELGSAKAVKAAPKRINPPDQYLLNLMTRVALNQRKVTLQADFDGPTLEGVLESAVRAEWMREKAGAGDAKEKDTASKAYRRSRDRLIDLEVIRMAPHAGENHLAWIKDV